MRKLPARKRMQQTVLIDLPEPGLHCFEEHLYSRGFRSIAGVDEAGRGSLAGPVVAAAVILPQNLDLPGLNDSKQLSKSERERFYDEIRAKALGFGVGIVSPAEIDRINILEASLEAMRIAVEGLSVQPDYLLIDGPFAIDFNVEQRPIKKGDALSHSIAAASVIAKVTRDRMMCDLEGEYPSFKFSVHKGYGTELHLSELKTHGPTPLHRMTFRGVVQKENYLQDWGRDK
ncbi:MAG: ribonuclease HII [Pseudomonadota bacterium]